MKFFEIRKQPYFRYLLFLCTFIMSSLFAINSLSQRMDWLQFRSFNITIKSISDKNSSDTGCIFPDFDPWDPTILEYIKHPSSVKCKNVQPSLTFIDANGYLRYDESEYESYLISKNYSNLKCVYKTFDRSLGMDDSDWSYATEKTLDEPVQLTRDMVEVKCWTMITKHKRLDVYTNLHAHPAVRDSRLFARPTEDQLSVLLMVIDSVSLSVLRRNMPLTYDYITSKMGMFMFKRFNKIGDNTLPNMMAALTGKRVYYEQRDMPDEVPGFDKVEYYDSFPLIWKFFAAKGYATVFNEDKPEWGMFHYLTEGFTKKPTDFYYHIFWEAIRKMVKNNKNSYSKYCFGNKPKGDILIDITKRHLMTMKDTLQFIVTFFVEYSHDYANEIERADKLYAEFWREMFEDGYLNRTAVIFMSDHGHRFSSVRETLVGLLEERNPFFGMWFPDWFYDKHPQIKRNLQLNIQRYSSTFDIHETLKDILDANYYEGSQRSLIKRGLSQLYELPTYRTCSQAGVPEHFCLCIQEKPLNISLPFVENASEIVITHLNLILSSYKQCQNITFERTLRAESVGFDQKVKNGYKAKQAIEFEKEHDNRTDEAETTDQIRLAIKTQPNDAIFEAIVVRNSTINDTWIVKGSVQRLNSYTNTSYCIDNAVLRKYCSCK